MDVRALQKRLRDFAEERNWTHFHNPKNLSMALVVEAAELAELFQWKTPEESKAARMEPEFRARIGEEAADVLLYLLQIADHSGVDLSDAVDDKLAKNATKYPVPLAPLEGADENPRAPQTHVLVDWENVQPQEVDIRALVPDVTHVWIFHGPSQKRVSENQKSFGDALTLVPISRTGKNALDFHLSYYMGYISSRNPNAKFVVIANDQGYGPMLDHANELGFVVSQVGFGAQGAAVKRGVAKKAATKKVSATKVTEKSAQPGTKAVKAKAVTPAVPQVKKKTVALKKNASKVAKAPQVSKPRETAPAGVEKPPAVKPLPQESPSIEQTGSSAKSSPVADGEKAYVHVLASLRKSKHKPTRKARLYGAIKSLLGASQPDDAVVERTVQRLLQEGHVAIDAAGAVTKTP